MSTENKDIASEKEIDLLALAKKLWEKRRFIIKISLIGFVVGIIIAFSIPKEYKTTVIMAPDSKSSGGVGNMGALAAMAGINLQQGTDDAISPELYPDLLSSTPFLKGLFNVQVQDKKQGINSDLYTYFEKEQSSAWWGYVLALPSKLLRIFSSPSNSTTKDTVDSRIIELTPKQTGILNNLKNRISISVDKKTGVITLSTIMQSPEISASVADTVTSYMQNYIIRYRTEKARQDLTFTEKLYEEAKKDYYTAQQNYAVYSDGNMGVVSARYRTTQERLQNEMSLAYTVYNQMAQQLQLAKVKVQDTTPVYTVIQPAVVPLVPESPKKKLIIIGLVFLFFTGASSWVIIKDFFQLNNKNQL
ncbi:chain-length determining protein [Dysgonomonas sp. OttesenSCG-928-M03]|nr:chain-length determining protein [Dysgonomonas sp. OttesenSCG-928-M03]